MRMHGRARRRSRTVPVMRRWLGVIAITQVLPEESRISDQATTDMHTVLIGHVKLYFLDSLKSKTCIQLVRPVSGPTEADRR
jgi:hypothetical protein